MVLPDKVVDAIRRFHEARGRPKSSCRRKTVWAAFISPEGRVEVSCSNNRTPGRECTNEKGNCGCTHAEPALMACLSHSFRCHPATTPTRGYVYVEASPCVSCVQILNQFNNWGVPQIDAIVYGELAEHWSHALGMGSIPILSVNDI